MNRILLIIGVLAGGIRPALAQIEWTPYENNPVITPEFDNESLATYRPTVIKWQGMYHMWYGKLWLQTRWIAYATSEDGIEWTWADNAVLGPSDTQGRFDELEASHGSVVLDGDTLKMWYHGTGNDASGIGLAWSLDGYTWTKVDGPAAGSSVLDPETDGSGASVITQPTVIKHDGIYHMWYIRIKLPEARLGYARSTDGRHWQVVTGAGTGGAVIDLGTGNAFDASAIQWPTAVYNGERFEMWYQGLRLLGSGGVIASVGCARSDDGITWEKIAGAPTLAGECFRSIAEPFVLFETGLYKMWYTLSLADDPNDDVVMYATSGQASTATEENELPSRAGRLEIYPNPTVSQASVRFEVARQDVFELEVRDVLGRLVSRLDLGARTPGVQVVTWNGTGLNGSRVSSGAYVLSIARSSTGERIGSALVHVLR